MAEKSNPKEGRKKEDSAEKATQVLDIQKKLAEKSTLNEVLEREFPQWYKQNEQDSESQDPEAPQKTSVNEPTGKLRTSLELAEEGSIPWEKTSRKSEERVVEPARLEDQAAKSLSAKEKALAEAEKRRNEIQAEFKIRVEEIQAEIQLLRERLRVEQGTESILNELASKHDELVKVRDLNDPHDQAIFEDTEREVQKAKNALRTEQLIEATLESRVPHNYSKSEIFALINLPHATINEVLGFSFEVIDDETRTQIDSLLQSDENGQANVVIENGGLVDKTPQGRVALRELRESLVKRFNNEYFSVGKGEEVSPKIVAKAQEPKTSLTELIRLTGDEALVQELKEGLMTGLLILSANGEIVSPPENDNESQGFLKKLKNRALTILQHKFIEQSSRLVEDYLVGKDELTQKAVAEITRLNEARSEARTGVSVPRSDKDFHQRFLEHGRKNDLHIVEKNIARSTNERVRSELLNKLLEDYKKERISFAIEEAKMRFDLVGSLLTDSAEIPTNLKKVIVASKVVEDYRFAQQKQMPAAMALADALGLKDYSTDVKEELPSIVVLKEKIMPKKEMEKEERDLVLKRVVKELSKRIGSSLGTEEAKAVENSPLFKQYFDSFLIEAGSTKRVKEMIDTEYPEINYSNLNVLMRDIVSHHDKRDVLLGRLANYVLADRLETESVNVEERIHLSSAGENVENEIGGFRHRVSDLIRAVRNGSDESQTDNTGIDEDLDLSDVLLEDVDYEFGEEGLRFLGIDPSEINMEQVEENLRNIRKERLDVEEAKDRKKSLLDYLKRLKGRRENND